jgi:hypothetical protein
MYRTKTIANVKGELLLLGLGLNSWRNTEINAVHDDGTEQESSKECDQIQRLQDHLGLSELISNFEILHQKINTKNQQR